MAERLEGRGCRRTALHASVLVVAATFSFAACRAAKNDGPAAESQKTLDWKSRVKDAQQYAERRKKEWAVAPVQSAIGVQVLAGEPHAGVKPSANAQQGAANTVQAAVPAAPPVAPPNVSAEQFAAMRERARNAVNIVVYTASWCAVCRMARESMNEHRIAFVERDVGKRTDWKNKLLVLNPKGTVPTFDIDGLVMIGFGEEPLSQLIARASDARLARLLPHTKPALVAQP